MKTFSKILLIVILFCQAQVGYTQTTEIPRDTVHYTGSQEFDLLIVVDDYDYLRKEDDLPEIVAGFQAKLSTVQDQIAAPHLIDYYHLRKIDIKENKDLKSFDISTDDELVAGYSYEARIFDPSGKYHVLLKFNDVAAISQFDFKPLLGELVDNLPDKQRYLRYLEFGSDLSDKKIKMTDNTPSGAIDMLSLMAGVGANVYRNKFLTDISGEISLQLSKKGILRNQFYVSNNLMFAFNAENTAIINNFTNVGYRRNLSNDPGKPNWLGVEFGTVTKRSGDIFEPNTMRLGANWQAGKHISIAPQLYFNGAFKQVSPGIRIGIGF